MINQPFSSEIGDPAGDVGTDLENTEIRESVAQRIREFLYRAMVEEPGMEFGAAELESHFAGMPQRYWLGVGVDTCRWHLSALRAFFKTVVESEATTTSPILRWRCCSERDVTEVIVCSWDRPGLLMNIAGALSRAGFDILRADAYTRKDHLVLDAFEVREVDGRSSLHEVRLKYASRLLNAAMAAPGTLPVPDPTASWPDAVVIGPDTADVMVDNETSPEHTILRIDAKDQPSLLFRILEALVGCGVSVEQAMIATIKGRARDAFYLTDVTGGKILSPARLMQLARAVRENVAKRGFGLSVWGADPLNIIDQHDWSGGRTDGDSAPLAANA